MSLEDPRIQKRINCKSKFRMSQRGKTHGTARREKLQTDVYVMHKNGGRCTAKGNQLEQGLHCWVVQPVLVPVHT
jgi:hypothetical protein